MLAWSKIDTWQNFQRLCNALFELEMNSTDFMPSDPDVEKFWGHNTYFELNNVSPELRRH